MLAKCTATIESIEAGVATVTPLAPLDSICLELQLPAFLAHQLDPPPAEPFTFHTILFFEQQAQGTTILPRLVGFASPEQRDFFRVFTTTKGIGPRKALRSFALPPSEIAAAIAAKDTKLLATLPEIGKRTAETIVAELSGKVDRFIIESGAPTPNARPTAATAQSEDDLPETALQVVAALIRLGESNADARKLVHRVVETKPDLQTPDDILAAAVSLRF